MKRKALIYTIIISSLTILSCTYIFPSYRNTADKDRILQNLKNSSGKQFKFYEDSENRQISLSGKLSKRNSSDSIEALKFINEIKPVLSINNVNNNFTIKSLRKDELGFTHIVLGQIFNNITVEKASISVHFDSSNVITNVTANINYDVMNSHQQLKRNITKENADSIIKKEFADNNPQIKFLSETVISKKSHIYFCYKYNVHYKTNNLGSYDVYVDMATGRIVNKINKIIYQKP